MPTFSLITLNCFGVPVPSTRRRLLTLVRELNHRDDSMVCLQEVQARPYRALLSLACAPKYHYSAFEPFVHAPKGGLLTLSRLPFEKVDFTLYRERGLWYTPAMADWLLHKGVLRAQARVGDVPVIVLNTHLSANYRGDWITNNQYARSERRQLEQLAEIVHAQPSEAVVIVVGDFNVPRASSMFQEFLAASGLSDPLAGDTRWTFRTSTGIPARFTLPIDFALLRAPDLPGITVQSDLCFREKVPFIGGGAGFLSDHCGVELRVSWKEG